MMDGLLYNEGVMANSSDSETASCTLNTLWESSTFCPMRLYSTWDTHTHKHFDHLLSHASLLYLRHTHTHTQTFWLHIY